MAVIVRTKTPKALLVAIEEAMREGHIVTWSIDEDGDLTHTASQWNGRAWFRPRRKPGVALVFNIFPPRNKRISRSLYGVYHGRLVEMLLNHFDSKMDAIEVTSFPQEPDSV